MMTVGTMKRNIMNYNRVILRNNMLYMLYNIAIHLRDCISSDSVIFEIRFFFQ